MKPLVGRKAADDLSPGQTDSQVNASLQNQNLRTDLRRVAKRIRKSACKLQKTEISRISLVNAFL